MALPNSVDPTSPLDSDQASQGADQIRKLKLFLVDVLGLSGGTVYTVSLLAPSAGGLLGKLRVANGVWLTGRNVGDTADVNLIRVGALDNVEFGVSIPTLGVVLSFDNSKMLF